MRPLVRTLPLALLLVCATTAGPVSPAFAVIEPVTIQGSSFGPAVTIGQGSTVRWTNQDGIPHSVQSNQGFFSSPDLGNGGTFAETAAFRNAGSYGYHCRQHGHMTGVVKVRMRKVGSAGDGWTVRWSSLASTPGSRTFDVQIDRPGPTGFVAFRTNTSARAASFNPAQGGTYKFKARTDNTVSGQSSGYSPVLSVLIS